MLTREPRSIVPEQLRKATAILSLFCLAACAGTIIAWDTEQGYADTAVSDTSDAGDAGDAGQDHPSAGDAGVAIEAPRSIDAGRRLDAGFQDAPTKPVATRKGRSAGCGRGARGSDTFDNRTLRVGDRDRTYHVRVPSSYDPQRAYPLVFRWHGRGGNGLSGGLDIERAAGSAAIVVAADGIDNSWSYGTTANDLQLFDGMLGALSEQYCIDLARVFAYGFSAGGGMTNLLGCERADKLRATAAIASFDRADARCDGAPLAAWFRHDRTDSASPISGGRSARDRVARRAGCSRDTTMVNGCMQYVGCRPGYPVVWCETNGLGHDIAGDSAPASVWQFFSTLP